MRTAQFLLTNTSHGEYITSCTVVHIALSKAGSACQHAERVNNILHIAYCCPMCVSACHNIEQAKPCHIHTDINSSIISFSKMCFAYKHIEKATPREYCTLNCPRECSELLTNISHGKYYTACRIARGLCHHNNTCQNIERAKCHVAFCTLDILICVLLTAVSRSDTVGDPRPPSRRACAEQWR